MEVVAAVLFGTAYVVGVVVLSVWLNRRVDLTALDFGHRLVTLYARFVIRLFVVLAAMFLVGAPFRLVGGWLLR